MDFFKFFIISALFLTITSCGKDDEVIITPDPVASTFWKCKIDGVDFETTGLYAYSTSFDSDNTIGIYGIEDPAVGTRTFNMLLDDAGIVGNAYDLSETGNGYGAMTLSDPSLLYYSDTDGGSGTVDITSIDEQFVEGTFSFTAVNSADATDVVQITEGTFKVEFR